MNIMQTLSKYERRDPETRPVFPGLKRVYRRGKQEAVAAAENLKRRVLADLYTEKYFQILDNKRKAQHGN